MNADTKAQLLTCFERIIADTSAVERCLHVMPWLGEEDVASRMRAGVSMLLAQADDPDNSPLLRDVSPAITVEDGHALSLLASAPTVASAYGAAYLSLGAKRQAVATMEMTVVLAELCAPLLVMLAAASALRVLGDSLPQLRSEDSHNA